MQRVSTELDTVVKSYAAYNDNIKGLRNQITDTATPPPARPARPGYVLQALVDPDTISALSNSPQMSLNEFSKVPTVQLKLQDLQEDIDAFIIQLKSTETQNSDGSLGTQRTKIGVTEYLLLLF